MNEGLVFSALMLVMAISDRPEVEVQRWGISYQVSTQWAAEYAVDGERTTCSHTLFGSNPWWILDLRKPYYVTTVTVTNRLDCCSDRIKGATIRIGFDNDVYSNPLCVIIASIPLGATSSFSCGGMLGQFVSFDIPGNNKILTLCEVQVFVVYKDNLATGQSVTQSSTFGSWTAEKATDFNPGVLDPSSWCSKTQQETNPWWRVDLSQVYQISLVVISNRVDCCPEEISGVEVHIGNSLENNGNSNPTCALVTENPDTGISIFFCDDKEARYVNLLLPGDAKSLTLCEVDIYGTGPCFILSMVKIELKTSVSASTLMDGLLLKLESALAQMGIFNVRLRWKQTPVQKVMHDTQPGFLSIQGLTNGSKAASQSSRYGTLAALNAVDGSPTKCSNTQYENNPWWRLDLTYRYQITHIAITVEGGPMSSRILGAEIRVGNTPDIFTNHLCDVISNIPQGGTKNFSCGGTEAHFVVVDKTTAEALVLCEVKVYGYFSESASLWRTTSQSSLLRDSRSAVDGLLATYSETQQETDPWWSVDLLHTHIIDSVAVTNKYDDLTYNLINGAEIRVGNAPDFSSNPTCATITTIPSRSTISYPCGGMEGRYVIIHIPGTQKTLSLAEIDVYGDLIGNLATNGTVAQSSTFDDWFAEKAIDGNRGMLAFTKGCSSTLNETNPWWSLDLHYAYEISKVVITNRRQGNAQPITGIEVRIGNVPENNGNDNPLCEVMDIPKGPVVQKTHIKIELSSSSDLTAHSLRSYLLSKLESALASSGIRELTLNWNKPPQSMKKVEETTIPGTKAQTYGSQENIALNKNAVQSSTFVARPYNGIDNVEMYCTYTQTQSNPWWRLDMRASYSIKEVVFTNRFDCCSEQNNGAQIRIGNSLQDNGNSNPLCAVISNIPAGGSTSYPCQGMVGRYVNVVIPGDSRNLAVCEVKVYYNETLRLYGDAAQSSVFEYWNAGRAIDGVILKPGSASFCTHTREETNPWWRVDLLDYYHIDNVIITNRIDNYQERIIGAEIRIGNSLENNGNNNPIELVMQEFWVENLNYSMQIASTSTANPARKGNAVQSSTDLLWIADNAIDGIKNDIMKCSSTAFQKDPYWRLNLTNIYRIQNITITNRIDCCARLLTGAQIRIGNSLENNGNNNSICAVIESIPLAESATFSCNGMIGQFVNVMLPGNYTKLTLCEVEVSGTVFQKNRSLIKFEFQSSVNMTDSDINSRVLQKLESALNFSEATLNWFQTPVAIVEKDQHKT
ncbi:hypothetical protein DNTS_012034 [Danionella cerebrum]|uniref:F5/8 type C domain-containing protein n=1 Tax=Danionella cerebrum TaxID=2873325 RepID=A0A553MX90_9TELE|nr:hypothetical protein DNTS_012034 [Danionella translucida]